MNQEFSSSVRIDQVSFWDGLSDEPLDLGSLLIEQGRISSIGDSEAKAEQYIDAGGRLLMPGLIQTHLHVCQTLFRGWAEDKPLLPWLREDIWPLEAAHDEPSLRASAILCAAELIRGGTTSFLSMETTRHTQAVLEVMHEVGLSAVVGHCFMDETSECPSLEVDMKESLAYFEDLLKMAQGMPLIELALAPRFVLACSEKNLISLAELAREKGCLLHTHASEQRAEVDLVRARTGKYNIRYLHDLGLTGPDLCLAHCVHTEVEEVALLKQTGTKVLHCPSANMKLGSGIAPIPQYLSEGICVSLGADGAPCNNRLDIFSEMRLAGLLQHYQEGPGALKPRDILNMALVKGAETLRFDQKDVGLKVGARADLIVLDRQAAHCLPAANLFTQLVYEHQASDVWLNMVNGKILYQAGEYKTIDWEKERVEIVEQAQRLRQRANI